MNHSHSSLPKRLFLGVATASLLLIGSMLSGCNDAQAGALLGAGIGALAGQAIGHDTQATLIGAAIGTGAGYIFGNESDKERAANASPSSRPIKRYGYRKPYSNKQYHSYHEHYHGCGHDY